MIEHIIPENIRPMKLGEYLRRAYPLTDVRAAFKKRDVKVGGARADADYIARPGDSVVIYARFDPSLKVLYKGEGLLCVVKPQGLSVDADKDGIGADTLLSRARLVDPAAELCHRLDAPTGGVILLATEPEAMARALAAFRKKRVDKRYTAYLGGAFSEKEGVYREYLIKDSRNSRVNITRSPNKSLPVETRWRIISAVDDSLSLAELCPVTGRTHQLRAHMAYHGHPILGDDKYGDRALNRRFGRKLCLWCARLELLGHVFAEDAPDWLNG